MEFLTPIFAAVGLAAASVPVVLHMLRRAPTQEMPFSLVRFLKVSQPRLTRRSSIEHWPLMLLRILALALIGMAFARPFLRQFVAMDDGDQEARSVTILIDKSASMRRDGIYEGVQEVVREAVAELKDEDLLSLSVFSRSSSQLISREEWMTASRGEREAMIEESLTSYEPDWMGTRTGAAMRRAADELSAEDKGRRNVSGRKLIVVTDFQRGSDLDELRSGDWPASVDVELKIVEPTVRGNVGVTFVDDSRLDRTRVRVTSAGDSVQQEFQLQTIDSSGQTVGRSITVTVPPGQRRSLVLPAADPKSGQVIAAVELLGDEHPFDNIVDLPEVANPVVRVAHIGSSTLNDPESMRYYLQRVLSGNVERDVKLVDLIPKDGIVLPVPDDVRLVVATSAIPESMSDSMEEFYDRSGTLLMAAPDVAAVRSLGDVLPTGFQVSEADVEDYAMLGTVDFDHPLVSAFADARFADFSSIRFWRHRNLQFSQEDRNPADWSEIALFDTGLPAIVELSAGSEGRVYLFASGWHPTDSQLALSTRFPPLLTRILSLSSPSQKDQMAKTVGDVIRPGRVIGSADWTLELPDDGDGKSASLTMDDLQDSTEADPLDATFTFNQPGRYLLKSPAAEDREERQAVFIAGVPVSETRTEMLPLGQLQVLGIGVESNMQSVGAGPQEEETDDGQLSASELEDRQKWWRWLLVSGLLCLIVESLWASAIERRTAAQ